MTRTFIASIAAAIALALPAHAEQFAVQIDAAYDGASPMLMETLKISEIESFSESGAHYIVLDAPSDAYVEAFFHAIGRKAIQLNVLEANWENPTMENLSRAQRLGFLRAIACDFCTS